MFVLHLIYYLCKKNKKNQMIIHMIIINLVIICWYIFLVINRFLLCDDMYFSRALITKHEGILTKLFFQSNFFFLLKGD